MAVKTEILTALGNWLENLGIFKKVRRGLIHLEDVSKYDTPLCVYNSFKTEPVAFFFNTTTRKMYVEIYVYNKYKGDEYFSKGDELETNLLKQIECIEDPALDIQQNVIKFEYVSSEEVINDDYIDGLYAVRIIVTIEYRE